MTCFGPLDLLGVIGKDRGFDELLPLSRRITIHEGSQVQLLDLAALIAIKEETKRDKDEAMLAILRRTLEEKEKKDSSI